MAGSVEKVYGNALFETAVSHDNVTGLLEEAQSLLQVLEESRDLTELLGFPRLTAAEKMEKLEQIFQGRLSPDMLGLLNIVLIKGRQGSLPGILSHFISEAEKSLGIGIVSVTVPSMVTDAQKQAVENRILSTTGYKTLKVDYKTDPSLIGGMIIRVGDIVVDSSIKTRLEHIERDISKIQLK